MESIGSSACGPERDQDQQQCSANSSSPSATSKRRSSLLISKTSSSRKRWSITSTSSTHSTSSSSSNSTAKRQSITTIRGFPLKFHAVSTDIADADLAPPGDHRLGAQSAPALLSTRVQYNRHSPHLLTSQQIANTFNTNTNNSLDNSNLTTSTTTLTKQVPEFKTNSEPIVQLKESSSSSASSSHSNSADESERTPSGSRDNLNRIVEVEDKQSEDSDDQEQVSETSRTSRIVKRRTVRKRKQTKQSSSANSQREEIIDSADIEEDFEEQSQAEEKQQIIQDQRVTDPIDTTRSSNNNEGVRINSFFRTRQIGGYQTSSSKTSIKTTSSSKKSSTLSSTSTTKTQQQGDNNNHESNTLSATSVSLTRSASKRHIATTATVVEQTTSSSPGQTVSSSVKAETQRVEEMNESSKKTETMANSILSKQQLANSTINKSPDLSNSSFPFEIERVVPDHHSSSSSFGRSSQIEAAESLVSHRERFSTSTSSSLRGRGFANLATEANQQQQTSSQQIEASSSSAHLLSSSSSIGSTIKAAADHRLSAASSTISASSLSSTTSSCASHTQNKHHIQASSQMTSTSAAAAAAYTTSSSSDQRGRLFSSGHHQQLSTRSYQLSGQDHAPNPFQIFVTSPDVRSLAQEIGTDFAQLESCLTRADFPTHHPSSQHHHLPIASSNLFGQCKKQQVASRLLSNLTYHPTDINHHQLLDKTLSSAASPPKALPAPPVNSTLSDDKAQSSTSNSLESNRSNRIRELLSKANNQSPTTSTFQLDSDRAPSTLDPDPPATDSQQLKSSAAMNESIERIEQKLSGICKKLNDSSNVKQAIELLEVLIQMIEKAWSVPVCGDDLGFRLCSSLRISGGLDFILSLILDAHDSAGGDLSGFLSNKNQSEQNICEKDENTSKSENDNCKPSANNRNQLRLSMPNETITEITLPAPPVMNNNQHDQMINYQSDSNLNSPTSSGPRSPPLRTTALHNNNTHSSNQNSNFHHQTKDSDSEILTSDLGLDSASVESFSYANTITTGTGNRNNDSYHNGSNNDENDDVENVATVEDEDGVKLLGAQPSDNQTVEDEDNSSLQRDELIFLSARLLSQCLTTDNRDYLVDEGWLESVVKLACRLAMIKSGQSHRKLLLGSSRCVLTRQSSTVCASQLQARLKTSGKDSSGSITKQTLVSPSSSSEQVKKSAHDLEANEETPKEEDKQADLMAAIGTEILQHLFKHSEETCITIISMGALEAILFGCRSSSVETLRHCAPALANLALHGGPQAHELMIEHKAHVWLFPLAFNEDDNVQYYACLAIVTLVANQEIEADVLKSSTLNLVEPFVTSHEPRRFAESNTAHIHGQSASWLKRLIPLLSSKREEARNLAAFHLAMEAYVKREQAQSHIFKEIGAIEPLKKLGGSPNAIASKFACQALRLIGEEVPHRLSQQVALWTSEDVIQWVGQIGFARYETQFQDSGVDGDLLLQLDETMLERDIGISNGITRRRFLRELSQLKRISDYSSLDRTGLCAMLGVENLQYAYAMLKFGVTRDNICHLDADNLLEECGIPNTIHRRILTQTIRSLQDKMALQAQAAADHAQNGLDSGNQKTLDVFVSYRRSTGSQLASLLKVHLQLRNFSVFIDVERLEAGKFDNNLLDSIKQARNFILVLSPNALDRCIDDFECKDWVHKEIVAALASDCNIIPIMDNFSFPDPDKLPEDMRSILYYNGVPWIHDYQDACVDKIERFIRGEVNKVNGLAGLSMMQPNTSVAMTNSSQHSNCGSLKRHLNQFSSPTPSIGCPITPMMNQQQNQQYPDHIHPLASAIHYQQQHQAGQNLFHQQQASSNTNINNSSINNNIGTNNNGKKR